MVTTDLGLRGIKEDVASAQERSGIDREMDSRGYVLRRKLGLGGFADCYIVSPSDDPLNERVLKLYKSSKFNPYFLTEIESLERLVDLPSVPNLYEKGQLDYKQRDFLIIEKARGQPIDDQILNFRERIQFLRYLAEAGADIHSRQIIHGDLKNENVFYEPSCEESPVQVIDFNISQFGRFGRRNPFSRRLLLKSNIKTLNFLGSTSIAALEQFEGKRWTEGVDVQAFAHFLNATFNDGPVYPVCEIPSGEKDPNRINQRNRFYYKQKKHWTPEVFFAQHPSAFQEGGQVLRDMFLSCMKKDPWKRPRMIEIAQELDSIWREIK